MNRYKYFFLIFLAVFCFACSKGDAVKEINSTNTKTLWKTHSLPHYRSVYRLTFTSHNGGWATGERGGIFSYNNKWTQVSVPTQEQLFSLSVAGKNKGYAVGSRGTVLLYRNGQWTQEELSVEWDIMDVFFLNEVEGWAVGENSIILQHNDKGWKEYNAPRIGYLTRVYFTDQSN